MEIIRKLFSIYESINSWVDIKYHQIASRLHVFICKLIFFMATNWEQFDLLYSICKHIWIFVKALLCFFHCGDSVAYVVDGSLIYYFHISKVDSKASVDVEVKERFRRNFWNDELLEELLKTWMSFRRRTWNACIDELLIERQN